MRITRACIVPCYVYQYHSICIRCTYMRYAVLVIRVACGSKVHAPCMTRRRGAHSEFIRAGSHPVSTAILSDSRGAQAGSSYRRRAPLAACAPTAAKHPRGVSHRELCLYGLGSHDINALGLGRIGGKTVKMLTCIKITKSAMNWRFRSCLSPSTE